MRAGAPHPPAARAGLLSAATGASLVLHGAVFWFLLPHRARGGMDQPPPIEVEFVDQAATLKGSEQVQPAAPPPPVEPPPLPADQGDVAAVPPPPPAPQAPAGPTRFAAVNLGDAAEDQDDLLVTGANVKPARPEAAFHNKPPAYPADAVRRGSEGTVGLLIHVTEAGTTAWVDVSQSSGDPVLDRAAREAVSLWRFQPARSGGAAVPFDYPINIRFNRHPR